MDWSVGIELELFWNFRLPTDLTEFYWELSMQHLRFIRTPRTLKAMLGMTDLLVNLDGRVLILLAK